LHKDPCRELRQDINDKYYCRVYSKRLEVSHKSIKEKTFMCLPIEEKIKLGFFYPECGYNK